MGFVWPIDPGAGEKVASDDILKIREKTDWIKDNPDYCPVHNEPHCTGQYLNEDADHNGTYYSGHLSGYDSAQYVTYKSAVESVHKAANYSNNDSSLKSVHNGTHYSFFFGGDYGSEP